MDNPYIACVLGDTPNDTVTFFEKAKCGFTSAKDVVTLSWSVCLCVCEREHPKIFRENGLVSLAHNSRSGDFKIATLTYKTIYVFWPPAYIRDLISPYQPPHSLRSSNQLLLTVPRANLTTDQRGFSYSSPVNQNAIPLLETLRPLVHSSARHLRSFYFHSLVC